MHNLVVQWSRIHLPVQGTQVPSMVQKLHMPHGATKPGAATTEPQTREATDCKEKPEHCNQGAAPADSN